MRRLLTPLIIGLALALPAWADAQHTDRNETARQAAKLSEGVVKMVDKAQGKLTIKHGPLENLGMPAMTMVFRVKDAAMLDQVKEGDNIRFLAENVNGALTVVRLEPAR